MVISTSVFPLHAKVSLNCNAFCWDLLFFTLFTNILTYECMLGHQSLVVHEAYLAIGEFEILGETNMEIYLN